MEFTRTIGKIDPELVQKAQEKLSKVIIELGSNYTNSTNGSKIGGDPLLFSLLSPVAHLCTMNIPTAATDGKRYYWNPKFVLKLSRIGLRIVLAHEAWHAIYMHPSRRGSRLPKLWNIAVDYIVNGAVMEDFDTRKKDSVALFTEHLGKFMTLSQYAEMLKDPFKKHPGFENLKPVDQKEADVALPAPDDDRDLTDAEKKELERREKRESFFFADPGLTEDMRRPEAIYDFLYKLLPKCPKCGSVGIYKKPQKKSPKKDKGDQGKDKSDKPGDGDQGDQDGQGKKGDKKGDKPGDGKEPGDKGEHGKSPSDSHEHGDGQPCDCDDHGDSQGDGSGDDEGDCEHGCGSCGDGIDVFGLGGTVDDHMDTSESEEKLAKRVSDAIDAARRMNAGHIPGFLEDELGRLTAPKISWKDVIKMKLIRVRTGNGRNDWNRFRSRPMFSGLMVPKRTSYTANFGCLLDTSGSMSKEDMAFGISQLSSLDDKSEGTIVPADCTIYWENATKIKKCSAEELSKVKVVGRGGTRFAEFFADYETNIGKCDFLIVLSDCYLDMGDIADMQNPGVPVYWLVTSDNSSFVPPFGRTFNLRDL